MKVRRRQARTATRIPPRAGSRSPARCRKRVPRPPRQGGPSALRAQPAGPNLFPRLAADPSPCKASDMAQPSEPIISVLVADDDEDQRVLIEALLRRADGTRHQVTTVPDGSSALAALREKVFDVALLDLSMPGLDGLEVLEGDRGRPGAPPGDLRLGSRNGGHGHPGHEARCLRFRGEAGRAGAPPHPGLEGRGGPPHPVEVRAHGGDGEPGRRRRPHGDRRRTHAERPGARRARGRLRCLGAGDRRVGDGKGADRAGAAPPLRASRRASGGAQLRGGVGGVGGVGAVRPREGLVHRRGRAQDRSDRAGRRRHALPGRDRRPGEAPPGEAAARARDAHLPARRRREGDPDELPSGVGHEPSPAGAGRGGRVPGRSLLPHQRHRPRAATPAGAAGRHPPAGPPLPRRGPPGRYRVMDDRTGGRVGDGGVSVAGQRA